MSVISIVKIADIKEICFLSNAGYTCAEVRIAGNAHYQAVFSIGATGESVSVWSGDPAPLSAVYQTLLLAKFQEARMNEAERKEEVARFSVPWESDMIREVLTGSFGPKSRPEVEFFGITVTLSGCAADLFVCDWTEDYIILSESSKDAQDCNFTQEDLKNFRTIADRKFANRMKRAEMASDALPVSLRKGASLH